MTQNFPVRRLQALLHEEIPLAREMKVDIRSWTDQGLVIEAPLAPNINHHGTFFGGSAAALGILAGWSLVHLLVLDEGLKAEIVIQRVAVRYQSPAPGPVSARARIPAPSAWNRFLAGQRRHGMARLRIRVELECEGRAVAALEASYGAVRVADPG